jgi:uncharacterized protein (TIGR00369 family)
MSDAAQRSPFDELVGTEWLDIGGDEARGRVAVSDHHKQPHGAVHGGVYATLAESICSEATSRAVEAEGKVALGQSNNTTFLRPVTDGHLNAVARVRQRGRTTWVWDVEISDDEGRLCALVRMTAAVRPAPGSG